jgi:hypothetical protein
LPEETSDHFGKDRSKFPLQFCRMSRRHRIPLYAAYKPLSAAHTTREMLYMLPELEHAREN